MKPAPARNGPNITCGSCGYSQNTFNVKTNALAAVGLGAVIALGIAALLKAVADADASPRASSPRRARPKKRRPAR